MNGFVVVTAGIAGLIVIRALRAALAGKAGTPLRIHLVPMRASGQHLRDVQTRTPEFEERGFTRAGTYKVDVMRGVVLTAFVHERESLCAIIYHHPVAGCFVDVVSKSRAGNSFTATTAPTGGALDQREGQEKVFDRGLTVPALIDLTLSRRPSGPWEIWNAGNFAAKFEAAYAQEMDWRAGRGGVTSDEVRRQAKADRREVSEGDIQKATQKLQKQFLESRRDVR